MSCIEISRRRNICGHKVYLDNMCLVHYNIKKEKIRIQNIKKHEEQERLNYIKITEENRIKQEKEIFEKKLEEENRKKQRNEKIINALKTDIYIEKSDMFLDEIIPYVNKLENIVETLCERIITLENEVQNLKEKIIDEKIIDKKIKQNNKNILNRLDYDSSSESEENSY